MKSCGYCGRENGDEASRCNECGTALWCPDHVPSDEGSEVSVRRYDSSFHLSLKVGAAFVLIATAIFLVAARIVFDLVKVLHGGEIGKPGVYAVGMVAGIVALLVMAFVTPLLAVACARRCRSTFQGVVTICVSGIAIFGFFSVRELRWLLPGVVLGRVAGGAPSFYFGALIQLALGAWLLGWIGGGGDQRSNKVAGEQKTLEPQ